MKPKDILKQGIQFPNSILNNTPLAGPSKAISDALSQGVQALPDLPDLPDLPTLPGNGAGQMTLAKVVPDLVKSIEASFPKELPLPKIASILPGGISPEPARGTASAPTTSVKAVPTGTYRPTAQPDLLKSTQVPAVTKQGLYFAKM